jgi:hypothetical protein
MATTVGSAFGRHFPGMTFVVITQLVVGALALTRTIVDGRLVSPHMAPSLQRWPLRLAV